MQKNNNNMNKIVLGSVIATSAVILSTSGLAAQSNLRVFASAVPTSVSISNSSFTDGSVTPSNWNSITSQSSSVVARIVNTNAEEFENNKEDYKLTINPGKVSSGADNNVFMINSKNIATSYGYQSNEFNLASNGYYVISVPVRTQGTAWASVYLTDESKDFKLKCENITATDSYKTYTFYVATQTEALNVSLQLYLGSESNISKGAVFFDEIKAYSYAESTFYSLYQERNNNSASYVPSYTTRTWSTVDNNKLTKLSEDGSNANADGFVQKVYSLSDETLPEGVANPTSGNMIDNNYALLLNNKEEASVGVRYDLPINFKTYDYVLYSTYVKTNTSTGGLTLKLVEKNKDGEFVAVGEKISGFKSTTADNKFNGWEKVTFAIKTSAFKNKEIYTEYWLGNDSKAKGYAFIGKNEVVSITSEEYENVSTSSSVVKVNFDDLTEDSSSFKNHSFNNFEKDADYNNARSFIKPANLEKTDKLVNNYGAWNKTDNFASGIINANPTVFAESGYPFSNPGLTPNQQHTDVANNTNNVLAIYQNVNASQGYKTSSVELAAGSYYKISVYVKTQVFTALSGGKGIDNANGGASWTLSTNDVVISEFNNVVSNSEWTTLSTYIQTGLDKLDVTANLSLGNNNLKCAGVAFFDDMMVETATETEFKNAVTGNFVNVVDFKNDKFNLISANKNGYGLYESKNWATSQTDANAVTGVYDTQDVNSAVTSNFPNMPALTTQDNSRYALFINNKADLATSYSNTISQKLVSGSYYKVSVWAKVHAISQSDVNTQYEDDKNQNAIPYGAFISIDNVEDSFKAITNTEWKEYIFYVNSDTDIDLKLNLALGADDALTSGYAYFSNVLVEKMEEDAYNVATATYEEETPNNVIMVKTAKTEADDENTDNSAKPESGAMDYLIIPTLITGLALIIAIVGLLLRQINFNKFVKLKKKSNSYDRRKTNTKMKSVRRAEIENLVKEKVEELNATLAKLEELKVEQEQQVLDAKNKYLSYKDKKLSKEERKEKRLAKQAYYEAYNKLSNTYVDINIIKDDIAKIKSERYILKEEYAIMLEEWREQKKALKLEKKNQKAKQKLKKD